jgi:hypothetical protein
MQSPFRGLVVGGGLHNMIWGRSYSSTVMMPSSMRRWVTAVAFLMDSSVDA